MPSADRLQVSPRRRSANSQTAPRGFACWQNIAAGFDSRAKPRRWLLSDIFASLKCPRQIVYKFRLAAARRTRRPPLAVLPAGKTSLRASIPARSHAGGFSRTFSLRSNALGRSSTSFASPPLGELADRPSRFCLLAKHRCGLRFPREATQVASLGHFRFAQMPSADRLQVSPRRRSANSQTAPRGFACWQNIAAGFDSRAKPRRWLLSDIFASLKCPRQIVYKFRLAAARRTRRPPLAVLPAGKTSLRASIPARSHAGGFSRTFSLRSNALGRSSTSFASPPLGELADRPSRFCLLAKHRCGLRFPREATQVASLGHFRFAQMPSADRLQVSPRRRSANSQTAPRGFACWQNIAAGFDSRAKPRRWLLSDIFASLKCCITLLCSNLF